MKKTWSVFKKEMTFVYFLYRKLLFVMLFNVKLTCTQIILQSLVVSSLVHIPFTYYLLMVLRSIRHMVHVYYSHRAFIFSESCTILSCFSEEILRAGNNSVSFQSIYTTLKVLVKFESSLTWDHNFPISPFIHLMDGPFNMTHTECYAKQYHTKYKDDVLDLLIIVCTIKL